MENEAPQMNATEILAYFLNTLVIEKQETYAIELSGILSHIIVHTSQKLAEYHQSLESPEEKGMVTRLQFNSWVLDALGDLAKQIFAINEQIAKEAQNVDSDA